MQYDKDYVFCNNVGRVSESFVDIVIKIPVFATVLVFVTLLVAKIPHQETPINISICCQKLRPMSDTQQS